MYGPYLLAMLAVLVAVSASARDFDPRVFGCFAVFVGMPLETLYLRQSSWVTTGFWFDRVKRVYAIHEYLGIFNIVPLLLALTGVCQAFTLLKPHVTKWTCPVPLDLSASEMLKSYAGYILVAVVSPVILASYPLVSSISFLVFVAWYLFGFGMLIHWCIENDKKRKAAAPAATSTKGRISMSPTTHLRVKEFWRTQMFPREDLTKKMDFDTFTKEVHGRSGPVRNNQILTLFKETLEKAKLVVDDNRNDVQKNY